MIYMDYPLTEEQIKKIEKLLSNPAHSLGMLYARIPAEEQEAFGFLVKHRFVVNGSQFAINAYSNQFFKVASNKEILRQINEENTRILNERIQAERASRHNENIGKATLIVSILALIVGIIGLF